MFSLSIPSPDYDLQALDLGQWLRDLGLSWMTLNLTIHTYALCIMVGIVAASIMTNRRMVQRGAEPWVLLDILLFAVPLGMIGARIFHVVTHPDDYFFPGADLLRTLYIWEGGIAIFGALLGGAAGALIGCKISGIRFWSFADALAPGLLLAQAFGRFGNWFNHELFGLPTDAPWGLEIESTNPAFPAGLPEGTLFHPTFLYEVIWNLLGVAVLLMIGRVRSSSGKNVVPRLQWGRLFALYLVWYGAGRIVWESIRIDPSELFLGVRTNVWAAIAAVVLGVIIFFVQGRRNPGNEPSIYRPGHHWSPESQVDSEETYTDNDDDYRADGTVPAAAIPETAKSGSATNS